MAHGRGERLKGQQFPPTVTKYPNTVDSSRFPHVNIAQKAPPPNNDPEPTSEDPMPQKAPGEVVITSETRKQLYMAIQDKIVRVDEHADGSVGFSFVTSPNSSMLGNPKGRFYGPIDLTTGNVAHHETHEASDSGIPKDVLVLMGQEKVRLEAARKLKQGQEFKLEEMPKHPNPEWQEKFEASLARLMQWEAPQQALRIAQERGLEFGFDYNPVELGEKQLPRILIKEPTRELPKNVRYEGEDWDWDMRGYDEVIITTDGYLGLDEVTARFHSVRVHDEIDGNGAKKPIEVRTSPHDIGHRGMLSKADIGRFIHRVALPLEGTK